MAQLLLDADEQRLTHELRTAVTIVSGCVELLLERGPHASDERKLLEVVERGAERLLGAVRELRERA